MRRVPTSPRSEGAAARARVLRCLVLAVGLAGGALAPAFALDPEGQQADPNLIDPRQIPSVHNTFYKVPEGTVSWDVLGALDVKSESLGLFKTVFTVDYSPEVKGLDGQEVKLMGFIFPLEGKLMHERFLLTAWPPSCPFCLPAGPTQMVEVLCEEPVEFTDSAIMITGRFELLHDDPSGMHYRVHDARQLERFDDIRWQGQVQLQPLGRYGAPVAPSAPATESE
jgi:hypothetical protein